MGNPHQKLWYQRIVQSAMFNMHKMQYVVYKLIHLLRSDKKLCASYTYVLITRMQNPCTKTSVQEPHTTGQQYMCFKSPKGTTAYCETSHQYLVCFKVLETMVTLHSYVLTSTPLSAKQIYFFFKISCAILVSHTIRKARSPQYILRDRKRAETQFIRTCMNTKIHNYRGAIIIRK